MDFWNCLILMCIQHCLRQKLSSLLGEALRNFWDRNPLAISTKKNDTRTILDYCPQSTISTGISMKSWDSKMSKIKSSIISDTFSNMRAPRPKQIFSRTNIYIEQPRVPRDIRRATQGRLQRCELPLDDFCDFRIIWDIVQKTVFRGGVWKIRDYDISI